ncbi:MAG: rRNA cytosine-C5-methyltransferase [Paludibacteraceae bacterium]|nr:rRNA cytosine-C5-methyltransferase [Paludibacteraceae bacterium]
MELSNDFIELMRETLGDKVDMMVEAIMREPVTSLRVNPRKKVDIEGTDVPWCEWGKYLAERPRFTDDPRLHAGCFYVQEASSMFLWKVLEAYVGHGAKVLDACAAPGGKSTLIAGWLDSEGLLVSNEFVAKRANILVENLTKWGFPNVIVTNNALSQYERLGEVFDCVLVDAPCSGEGMFRKDDIAVREWSLDNVRMCVERQREIIVSAWKTLEEGGIMVYSTCTFNHYEDDDNVRWIIDELGGEVLDVEVDGDWGIERAEQGGYHFYPHKVKGEGLFMAVLRKTKGCGVAANCGKGGFTPIKDAAEWLTNSSEYQIYENKNVRWAMPKRHFDQLQAMAKARLNIFAGGVQYAELKGRDWIPAAGLALSCDIDQTSFVTADVDKETALKFLRCETITIADVPKGIILVRYEEHPLGWVKNVGNRCNNLYPQYWRIRN